MKAKMAFLGVLIAVVLPLTSMPANGQTPREAQNAISIDVLLPILSPMSLFMGEGAVNIPLNIQYQRVLSDHLVLLIKAGLNYAWTLPNAQQARWVLDVYPVVEVDWHPFQKGLKGFYLGLSGIFNYTVSYSGAMPTVGTSYYYRTGLGPTLGWEFLSPANIIIDLALGLGYGYAVNVDVNGAATSGFLWDPTRVGVFLGFRF